MEWRRNAYCKLRRLKRRGAERRLIKPFFCRVLLLMMMMMMLMIVDDMK